MDISDLRREYTAAPLRREDLCRDPFEQFERWFAEAVAAEMLDVNAMVLATVTDQGAPAQRTVLLKYVDHGGFVFFTNLESRKAHQLAANPRASLLFLWAGLARQLIIDGTAERISAAASLKYFLSRPRGSQLGAWVSQQSSVISSRQLLEVKFEEMKRKFSRGSIPLPSFWGGYRVVPSEFEFWQGQPNRLHDRFRYRRGEAGGWIIERLAP